MNYRKIISKHYHVDLTSEYDVHHIDGNRENNCIENLMVLPSTLHKRYHFLKGIVASKQFPVEVYSSFANSEIYYLEAARRFIETLEQCNQWYDYKLYLDGLMPNIHGLSI